MPSARFSKVAEVLESPDTAALLSGSDKSFDLRALLFDALVIHPSLASRVFRYIDRHDDALAERLVLAFLDLHASSGSPLDDDVVNALTHRLERESVQAEHSAPPDRSPSIVLREAGAIARARLARAREEERDAADLQAVVGGYLKRWNALPEDVRAPAAQASKRPARSP